MQQTPFLLLCSVAAFVGQLACLHSVFADVHVSLALHPALCWAIFILQLLQLSHARHHEYIRIAACLTPLCLQDCVRVWCHHLPAASPGYTLHNQLQCCVTSKMVSTVLLHGAELGWWSSVSRVRHLRPSTAADRLPCLRQRDQRI